MYSKKSFGIKTLSCSEGTMVFASWMTLKSSEIKNFLSWRVSTKLKTFLIASASSQFALPHFMRPMLRVLQIRTEDNLSVSRICERSVFGQGARLLSWRSASGILLRWRPHGGRGSGQCPGRSGQRRARDRRDTQERNKARNRENKIKRTTWMTMWMRWCARADTWANVVYRTSWNTCAVQENKWRVKCILSTPPSVTVPFHRIFMQN